MISAPRPPRRTVDSIARLSALAVLVALGGCQPPVSGTGPEPQAQRQEAPAASGALPEVTVTLKPTSQTGAEITGFAWYVTSVKDPARGSYTAAVERRSLTRLWFDVSDEGEQRATIVLPLRQGRPTGLILSIEHGRFVCAGPGKDNVCALRVSVDGAAPRAVQFAAPRHQPATSLRLVAGDDAQRLLAAIAKGKRLRIQPTFEEEGSPEIEFGLNGLNPTIARLVKRSVAAMPRVAANAPGV
jgi:hypothetical protein